MKLLLLLIFVISALACTYFMVCFLRELKKSIAKQEPPPIGLLALVILFVFLMLIEASAAISILIRLQ